MSYVHNHGPAEGPGLDCPEHNLGDNLVGRCLLIEAGILPEPIRFIVGLDPATPEDEVRGIVARIERNRGGESRVYYADWDGKVKLR